MSVQGGNTLTEEKADHNFNILLSHIWIRKSGTDRLLCFTRTTEDNVLGFFCCWSKCILL